MGGKALVALAILKSTQDKSHPVITKAVERVRKYAEQVRDRGIARTVYNGAIYDAAICCIFLSDLDAERYAGEIGYLLTALLKRQQADGSWSYDPYNYSDTSQTQYGILCLWAAHQHGITVPVNAVERAANWVMATQHPNGGWSYRPRDGRGSAVTNSGHVKVTHSMTVAGAGSLYVCAHVVGLVNQSEAAAEERRLPPAVTRVDAKDQNWTPFLQAKNIDKGRLSRSQASGNAWFSQNLKYDVPWTHYYMYGMERYKSFQELAEGKTVSEPVWYNQGVEYLQQTQKADGSWQSQGGHGSSASIDTAFAVLFLTRSSQTSIRKAVLDEGILLGGKTLPKNLTNIMMQDGKVVTPQMIQDVDSLLKLLEETEDLDFDPSSLPGGLPLDEDLTKRTSQLEKLREMVSDDKYEKRLAAVKTLARARELDNVPALIYALTDPAPQVALEARDGLRFISRKFFGFGLIIEPIGEGLTGEARTEALQAQRSRAQAAQAKWTEWYLSIRPEGELIH